MCQRSDTKGPSKGSILLLAVLTTAVLAVVLVVGLMVVLVVGLMVVLTVGLIVVLTVLARRGAAESDTRTVSHRLAGRRGLLLGVLAAELVVRPPVGPRRSASLTPRRSADYLPRRLGAVVVTTGVTLLSLSAVDDGPGLAGRHGQGPVGR